MFLVCICVIVVVYVYCLAGWPQPERRRLQRVHEAVGVAEDLALHNIIQYNIISYNII